MPVFTRFRQPTGKNDDLTDEAPTDKKPSEDPSPNNESPEPPTASRPIEPAAADTDEPSTANARTLEPTPTDDEPSTDDGPNDPTDADEPSADDQPFEPANADKPSANDRPLEPADADGPSADDRSLDPTDAGEPSVEGRVLGSADADGDEPPQGPPAPGDESVTGGAGGRESAEGGAEDEGWRRPYLRWALTLLAAALIYVCLQMPNTLGNLRLREFVRLPAEAVIGAAVLLSLPRRPRLITAAISGAALGALTVLSVLDMGFNEYLGRHFNIILDWELLDDAQSYMQDSMGGSTAVLLTIGAILLAVVLMTLVALATVHVANLLARHKANASKGALMAGTVWITCTAFGVQIAGVPIAADHTAGVVKVHAHRALDTLRDEAQFAKDAKADTFGATPPAQLVPDLRGKDIVFTFIESYGRSAIEDPEIAPGVTSTLDTSTKALAKAGFHARSGWLTSATFGGNSWLGHSTTLSGLWIDNQQRYRTVMASDHLSLTKVFKKTGEWDTVGVMPGVQKSWPEQKYYGLDKVYNAFQLGYKGPKFSWSTMPDQYALEAFQRQVHGKERDKPLMSEIILTSSHQPWAPIPKMVDWDDLGDGSVFKSIQKAGVKPADIISDSTRSKQEYGKSVSYSVTSLTQWLERYGTDDTVLVFLGDHQPMSRVSGVRASRDVPISIVAKDPKVLDKIADWNWTDGLQPAPKAPVWKMSSFRDRFLTAYGSTPNPSK
ncbi:CDP-alcohol phosphatidyltransferase [Streptomyces osmaniensis]|uniref:CDP-alcohol phosphatidyltransferase n=2 Tax=Actinomycetes TaxID=1760 RepID=A0ABP6V170_9ACTN